MLHNEARELLVEGYETTHNAEAIAKIFHVNKYTVYHLEEQKRKTGSVDLQTWRRGRKALLNTINEQIRKNAQKPQFRCNLRAMKFRNKLQFATKRFSFLGGFVQFSPFARL